jgi:FkbM family methyltransferase
MKIAIIDIIGIPYDGSTVFKQGLGGSESAVTFVSRELARLGFDVTVFNNCNTDHAQPGVYEGVNYVPLGDLARDWTFDVVISSRTVIPFVDPRDYPALQDNRAMPFQDMDLFNRILSKAKQRILWMHDTFCLGDHFIEKLAISDRITDIFALSDWHLTYVTNCQHSEERRNYEVLKRKMFITRNGARIYNDEVDITAKDRDLFVYNASVTKGMVPLVKDIWPHVKKHIPNAKLKIIGGYYRFSTSSNPDQQELDWRQMSADPANKALDIEFTGVISQREISEILTKANFMIYPCAFPETFGISTLESICYNTPVITCRFGGLEEVAIEGASYLIDYAVEPNGLFPHINKPNQVEQFVKTTIEAYYNTYLHQQKQYYCNIVKEVAGWDSVALQWKQFFFKKCGRYLSVDEYRKVNKINHRIHKIYNRRNHNVVELETHRVGKEQEIIVVSTFYNARDYIQNCIASVITQDYDNYKHILIDDCSTDDTLNVASEFISTLPKVLQDKIIMISNSENRGAPRNHVETIRDISDDAIVMLLDGDDCLVNDNSIFAYYNALYDGTTEFSYGSCWSMVDNIPLISQPYPQSVKKARSYRKHKFNWNMPYTHLRTFKKYLFNDIDDSMFKDENGDWYKAGGDGSVFYALIERADPDKVKCVQDIIQNYNDVNPLNDYKINSDEQKRNANSILNKMASGTKYSIVVPTMWRCNDIFLPFIDELCACDMVDDIIIINNDNSRTPDYDFTQPKIRMFDFGENTFVNPAWNFGVSVSKNDRICIVNDDVRYDLRVLDKLYDMLTPDNGVFGLCPGVSDFNQIPVTDKSIDIIEWAGQHTYGFGSLMWINKKSWIDVPEGLDIYYGDNFIFDIQFAQGKKNYIVANMDFYTPFAGTVGNKEISGGFLDKESTVYAQVVANLSDYIPKKEIPQEIKDNSKLESISTDSFKKTAQDAKPKQNTGPKKKILIAIPTARNIEPDTFKSIYDLEVPDGYETTFQFFFGYQVDQVRNLIAHWTVNMFDYLFSVDSDIVFEPDTLKKLLAHDKDVVSGLYIQRIPNSHTLEIYDFTPWGGAANMDYSMLKDRGLTQIAGCGFGCVLVKAEVFRGVGYPYFQYHSAIDHKDTISEDVDFCAKARYKGYTIWADPSIKCKHIGNWTYQIDDAIKPAWQTNKPVDQSQIYQAPEGVNIQSRLRDLGSQRLLPQQFIDFLGKLKSINFNPQVVYDIGSCVLHFTNEAERIWPNAEYIAFEAMDSAEFLYKERGLRYNIGPLSDEDDKTVEFYQNDYHPGGNSYYRENVEINPVAELYFSEANKKILKTARLDSVVTEKNFPIPDLIKMDVQGAEMDIIKGGLDTISKTKVLILELQHREYNKGAPLRETVISYLNSIGFYLVQTIDSNDDDGNYCFMREDLVNKIKEGMGLNP